MANAKTISALLDTAAAASNPLAGLAHVTRICDAIVAEYQRPECLVVDPQWCGSAASVRRLPDAAMVPDRAWPLVTVAPDLHSFPWALSREMQASCSIVVRAYYNETRAQLAATERAAPDFAGYLIAWLFRDAPTRALAVDKGGTPTPLLDHPLDVSAVDFGDVRTAEDLQAMAAGEFVAPTSERYLSVTFNARFRLGATLQHPNWQ